MKFHNNCNLSAILLYLFMLGDIMKMKKNSFIQGTVIASISLILIKILGALYVIPFYKIIGEQGGALYSYAYNIYNLFLNISTAGIPVAISMIISEYHTLGMTDAKERSYKVAKKIIFALSIISFVLIFVFADYFAYFLTSGNTGANSLGAIALSIRSVSICLLIVPFLSISRGYFQGHRVINVSSFSQIIEQVVRIIIILMGTYLAIKVLNSSLSS